MKLLLLFFFAFPLCGYANINSQIFAVHTGLKDKQNRSLNIIQTEPLVTDQANLATGKQEISFSLSSSASYPVKVEGVTVDPGQSVTIKKSVDAKGVLSLELVPQSKATGSAPYSINIDNIYSNKDRFWEPYDDDCSEWIDTGTDKNSTSWSPAIGNQKVNFTQTRQWDNVLSRNCRKREKDSNVGEIRFVDEPFGQTKLSHRSESREITVKIENNETARQCGNWSPEPSTVNIGTTFSQNRSCNTSGTKNYIYLNKADVIAEKQFSYSEKVTESQQRNGEKVTVGGWYVERSEKGNSRKKLQDYYPDNWDEVTRTEYVGNNRCAVGSDGILYCDTEHLPKKLDDNMYPVTNPGASDPCPVGAHAAYSMNSGASAGSISNYDYFISVVCKSK